MNVRAAVVGACTLAAAAGALTCTRISENVGRVSVADGGLQEGGRGGAGRGVDLDAFPSVDAPPALTGCAAPNPLPEAAPPDHWNCGPGCWEDPKLIGSAASFAGPTDPLAENVPHIEYPLAGSVHPPNVADLMLQWTRAPGDRQTVFRVRITNKTTTWRLHVPCVPPDVAPPPPENQCTFALPDWAWLRIARESVGRELTIDVAGHGATSTAVATSEARRISIANGAINGGFYYWSSNNVTGMTGYGTIYRMLFGGRKAMPFITPRSAANRSECAGCHAVSRDGSTIAFSAEQAGYLYVSRTDTPEQPLIAPATPPEPNANNMTLSPLGDRVLVSYKVPGQESSGRLAVWRTADGKKEADIDPAALGLPGAKLFFPEWSTTGEIVATVSVHEIKPWSVADGHLVVFPYNDGKFGKAETLVTESKDEFHYYPTWSPDGEWIAFVSAKGCGGGEENGCVSYDNRFSRLRLIKRSGGRVYDLTNATFGESTSTWPKFAPFALDGCKTFFLTFNSRRQYGFIVPPSVFPNPRPQLWMSRIDTSVLDSDPNADASSPPIWLPFQDPRGQNHLGFWTTKVVCGAGVPGSCGENEVCDNGQCVYNPTP